MSTGGLLVRFGAGMVIGIAAVVLCMGCATARRGHAAGAVLGAGQERGAWASPAELSWLQRLGKWETSLMEALDRASRVDSNAAAAGIARVVGRCTMTLEQQVGEAPTARLKRPLEALEQACTYFESATNETRAADAKRDGRLGGRLLVQADQLLPPGETRSLAVVAGRLEASHVDPRLSSVAGRLAGKQVEVRCWSRSDWARLLREEKAYTMHHIDDGTLGFAGISGTREDLAPEVCRSLAALAYAHRQPEAGLPELRLASAVATLAHEPQHSRGIALEAQAECNAIQLMQDTAVELGASREYAARLQALYWSLYDEELPAYRSPECRNGGRYDLRPADPTFP